MQVLRRLRNCCSRERLAKTKGEALPVVLYRHKSLIRRKLGQVDMRLQNNKAQNLALAAPLVSGIYIRPGETFSFWALVGRCTAKKGYLPGLTLHSGQPGEGIGGGMCQFTNLLHWLALHSPLAIAEHHHHDGFDLFPDFGRQVPFGCGTSIQYNHLDYRLKNETQNTFQLVISVTETHLCGELRALQPLHSRYHIVESDNHYVKEPGGWYHENVVERRVVDAATGNLLEQTVIRRSHARVMYDERHIPKEKIREPVC
jgi:vancomycin resistance protein VanW